MALFNDWQCVLPEDVEGPPFQRRIDESTVFGERHFERWRLGTDESEVGSVAFL